DLLDEDQQRAITRMNGNTAFGVLPGWGIPRRRDALQRGIQQRQERVDEHTVASNCFPAGLLPDHLAPALQSFANWTQRSESIVTIALPDRLEITAPIPNQIGDEV